LQRCDPEASAQRRVEQQAENEMRLFAERGPR
jgi:hypothetical protein